MAHEALIRGWPLLRAWIEEDCEGRPLHRRITVDSAEWRASGDAGPLYRGVRFAQAPAWLKEHADAVNADERSFLEAAERQRQQELDAPAQAALEREARGGAAARAADERPDEPYRPHEPDERSEWLDGSGVPVGP